VKINNSPFLHRWALIWVLLVVAILLVVTDTVIYINHKQNIHTKVSSYINNELLTISEDVQYAMLAGDYQTVYGLLNNLFQSHLDWLEINAITPNGEIIVHLNRDDFSGKQYIRVQQIVERNERELLRTEISYDTSKEYRHIKQLISQVSAGFLIIVLLLLTIVWVVVRKYLIIPLEVLQDNLQRREEKIRLLLNSTSDGIYANDLNGLCIMANSTCATLLGYENPEFLLGKHSHRLIHHTRIDGSKYPEEKCRILNAIALKEAITVDDEVFWKADGTSFPVEYRASPMYHEEEIVGIVVSFTDVSRRHITELQLRQAQKLEAIGQLAAGIAHEINTPTQFVSDNTSFLQESFSDIQQLLVKYEDLLRSAGSGVVDNELINEVRTLQSEIEVDYLKEEIPQAIGQSLEGLGRITKIVLAMKEFSHPGGEEKTPIDINRAIQITLDVSRNEWKYFAEIVTDLDNDLSLVPCLPGEFNQVILNIIINASHAIAKVKSKGSAALGKITIFTKQHDAFAEIRISDTGCGIPKENYTRIFEPFFTTKEVGKGTGQGLALAYATIVDKHSGTLTFESEEGNGSTFIIRLPMENISESGSKIVAENTP